MVMSGQIHSPAALPLKELPIPTEEEAVWAPASSEFFGEEKTLFFFKCE
jgi:hypothetical protein